MEGSFPRYPSIVSLDKRPEIFAVKKVVVTEKIHGSNFRVHFPLGMSSLADVKYGSHEMEHAPGVDFPLGNAVQWFGARQDLLSSMWEVIKSYGFSDATVFGEAHGPGIKAKGVRYSTGQEMLFRAFDIMVGTNFVTYDLFVEITDKMLLPRVHAVWAGEPSMESFDRLLEKPSITAMRNGVDDDKNLAEGIVIRSNPLFRNVFGEWLIAKHKSKKFTEKAEAPKERGPREATPADTFAEMFVTEGRVRNAASRLQDRGVVLSDTMQDIPKLLQEIVADLHKECDAEWKALGLPDKQLLGAASKVLAPIYRKLISCGHRATEE
jgi:hypothetical protein